MTFLLRATNFLLCRSLEIAFSPPGFSPIDWPEVQLPEAFFSQVIISCLRSNFSTVTAEGFFKLAAVGVSEARTARLAGLPAETGGLGALPFAN